MESSFYPSTTLYVAKKPCLLGLCEGPAFRVILATLEVVVKGGGGTTLQ